jgi:hypothetical protein
MADTLQDADALEVIELFPEFQAGTEYKVGDRVRYFNLLYKCVQAHTSQPDWTPDVVPALWTVVSVEEWPEWTMSTGAQDSYKMGDKVSHNGKHWESITDNNVWEPGVYGWQEVN